MYPTGYSGRRLVIFIVDDEIVVGGFLDHFHFHIYIFEKSCRSPVSVPENLRHPMNRGSLGRSIEKCIRSY